jgi:biopolymer transport protein ExbD
MAMRRKRVGKYQVQMPLTALIDIVFLLLIYFLLTTNFMVDEGIRVNLPRAKASSPQKEEVITIYVDREGRSFFQDRELSEGDLFEKLKAVIGGEDNRLVVVKADRKVVLDRAVKVMDIAKAAGAARLSLATEKDI